MNEIELLEAFRDEVAEPSTDVWLHARAAIAAAAREEPTEPDKRTEPDEGPGRRRVLPSRRALAVLAAAALAAGAITVPLTVTRSVSRGTNVAAGSTGGEHSTPVAATIRARVVDALSASTDTILFTQSTMSTPGQATITSESWDYPWSGRPGAVVRQAGSSSIDGAVQNAWRLEFAVPTEGATSATPTVEERPFSSLIKRRLVDLGVTVRPTVEKRPVSSLIEGEACGVSAQRLDIDFTLHTWQASTQSCVELAPGLDAPAGLWDPKAHEAVANIRELVADGVLRVVGDPTVGGQPMIELQSPAGGLLALQLWVDANTYLPVRSVVTGPTGDPNPGKTWTEEDEYTYLPPTAANLANLQLSVPAGFSEVVKASERG